MFQLIPQEYAALIEACYTRVYSGILAAGGWQITNFWEGFIALSSLIAQQLPNPALDHLLTLTQARPLGWCRFSQAEIPLMPGLKLCDVRCGLPGVTIEMDKDESLPSQENVQGELPQAVQRQRRPHGDDYEVTIGEAEPDLIANLTDDELEEEDEFEVYIEEDVIDEEE